MEHIARGIRKYGGMLFASVGVVFLALAFFAAPCMAEEPAKAPPAKALPGVPPDFGLVYGTGATHAEWGRTTYRISADGKVDYLETRGRGAKPKRTAKVVYLSAEEMETLIRTIEESGFFGLERNYRNPKVHDGWSRYITVRMNGKEHTVGVMNFHQAQFGQVSSLISKLADKKEATPAGEPPSPSLPSREQ